jgi:hypothetical protein
MRVTEDPPEDSLVSFTPIPSTSHPYYHCSIAYWYPIFSDITFRTILLPLSDAVADWLVQDGITLPDIDGAFPTRVRDEYDSDDEYGDNDDGSNTSSDHGSERSRSSSNSHPDPPPELLDVYARLESGIVALGGSVIPKMQWSCPKDASWMLPNNTLKCATPDEVFLLLKSSDRVAHDIETMNGLRQSNSQAERSSSDSPKSTIASPNEEERDNFGHVIAVKKWYDLKPGREFRCFVKDGVLFAISQRDGEFHQHLVDNLKTYRDDIVSFFYTSIRPRLSMKDIVFDCYVPQNSAKLRLMDFNPYGGEYCTQPLLFTWEEIHSIAADSNSRNTSTRVDMRVITDPQATGAIAPSETAMYGVPYDFVHDGATEQLRAFLDNAHL